jgi:diguanylate cyclase (GGDEF)-like protein
MEQAKLKEQQMAILFIDIDNFHVINDSYGCMVGDKLLQAIAEILTGLADKNDLLARTGSNEFGLLLPPPTNSEDMKELAQRILDSFIRHPVSIGSDKINIGVSIGMSIYPPDGLDSNTLIKNAGTALRQAKNTGRGYVLYSAQ